MSAPCPGSVLPVHTSYETVRWGIYAAAPGVVHAYLFDSVAGEATATVLHLDPSRLVDRLPFSTGLPRGSAQEACAAIPPRIDTHKEEIADELDQFVREADSRRSARPLLARQLA